MSADQKDEVRELNSRMKELELDLLAERDMRIGLMAKLGRAEWQIATLERELLLNDPAQRIMALLRSNSFARAVAHRIRGQRMIK